MNTEAAKQDSAKERTGRLSADDWASAACPYVGNDNGEPLGRLADWSVYDENTPRITGARPVVYVVKAGSAQFKVRIVSYYDEKMVSAMYKVEWAKL